MSKMSLENTFKDSVPELLDIYNCEHFDGLSAGSSEAIASYGIGLFDSTFVPYDKVGVCSLIADSAELWQSFNSKKETGGIK